MLVMKTGNIPSKGPIGLVASQQQLSGASMEASVDMEWSCNATLHTHPKQCLHGLRYRMSEEGYFIVFGKCG